MCWNCPSYFCSSIYLMSGHICYIPFSLELASRCEAVIPHSKWVGSGRVTLRYIFPAPPSRNRQPRSSTVTLRCTRTRRLSAPRAVALRHGLRVTEAREGSRGRSGGVLSQNSIFGQNPKIGCQEFNDLQTPKLSKKQLCDRTSFFPPGRFSHDSNIYRMNATDGAGRLHYT
jgi:hypothetical protein